MQAEAASNKTEDFSDIKIQVGSRLGSKVIIANNLNKSYGDRNLIKDLSFSLPQGGIVGIIGPNGVGKTTVHNKILLLYCHAQILRTKI